MDEKQTWALFSDAERTDSSPAGHDEPHWAFLDRSSMPLAESSRLLLEEWFAGMCEEAKLSIRSRLTSESDEAFSAALWELLLYRLFTRQGYDVQCEPSLPNSSKLIDFLVSRGDEAFYVEATIARRSASEQGADARRSRIYRGIDDQVTSRNFMLSIQVEDAGEVELPNLAALARRIQAWLDDQDPDAVTEQYADGEGELPELRWSDSGWVIVFEAIPVKPEARTDAPRRVLGMFMDETGGLINGEAPLRNALRGKRPSRYGDLDWPYVVAVCEYPFLLGDEGWHRKNALFGTSGVRYGEGIEPEEVRSGDGFWRGPGNRPLNTRVAAVLFGSHVAPWNVDRLRLEWWPHPFAASPIRDELIPDGVAVHRLMLTNGAGDIVATDPQTPLHDVL